MAQAATTQTEKVTVTATAKLIGGKLVLALPKRERAKLVAARELASALTEFPSVKDAAQAATEVLDALLAELGQ